MDFHIIGSAPVLQEIANYVVFFSLKKEIYCPSFVDWCPSGSR